MAPHNRLLSSRFILKFLVLCAVLCSLPLFISFASFISFSSSLLCGFLSFPVGRTTHRPSLSVSISQFFQCHPTFLPQSLLVYRSPAPPLVLSALFCMWLSLSFWHYLPHFSPHAVASSAGNLAVHWAVKDSLFLSHSYTHAYTHTHTNTHYSTL